MKRLCIAIFPLAVAWCATSASASGSNAQSDASLARPHGSPHPSLNIRPGVYRCDLNRLVDVRQISSDRQSAVLYWDRRVYTLQAVATETGALRYEDKTSGLTWITITGKSMLLDTRQGRQLANDCRV